MLNPEVSILDEMTIKIAIEACANAYIAATVKAEILEENGKIENAEIYRKQAQSYQDCRDKLHQCLINNRRDVNEA